MIKVSDYIFDFLKSKFVEHVFMLPGGGAMHLVDSLGKSGIEYTCFLHEQGASIAAEAYAQHSNRPGVVLVTSGPGATNAITAVTAGWIDSTPMFIMSGQAKRSDLVGDSGVRQIGSQEVQIVDMVKPITKYSVQILEPTEIKYHLERAWYEARNGRPGPVWLDIPLDVQGSYVCEEKMKGYLSDKAGVIFDNFVGNIDRVCSLLCEAQKPLLIVGNGVKLAGAEEQLYEFVNEIGIPVETTWKTIDMFGEDEDYYVGHPGIMGDRGANLILQEADLIFSIGSRLDTSITAFNEKNFGKNSKKIIVDIDRCELSRMTFESSLFIECDAKVFLTELLSQIRERKIMCDNKGWVDYCHGLRRKYPIINAKHRNCKDFVSAYYFIELLCDLLNEKDVIVPESSGGAGEITYQAFKLKKGQKMKNAAGLGSMGFGLPYSIGSCIANKKRRTILINGDGAFQLNIQELETLHRLNLPVKMFIWDNEGYASIRNMQRNNFEGNYVGSGESSGLTIPDIARIASAYGFPVKTISNNAELKTELPLVMSDEKPILCVIKVDPFETVSPRVKAYVGENGNMVSGLLENMWPIIDEDETV